MKWENVKLEDICISITDGDHQSLPLAESGIPFIVIADINSNNRIDFSKARYVPLDYYENLDKKRKPQKGDVLLTVKGSFGIPVYVADDEPFVFQRDIAILKCNSSVFPKYLYFYMKNRDFYLYTDSIAIGAAQRAITLKALKNTVIKLPPMEIQHRISEFLSSYDDLIENNQKQIKLLEEAAQRLYKEWFVDLRFPGYENTPVVDGMPEGWTEKNIADVCLTIGAGGTPNRSNSTYWKPSTIKWFKTGELQDCWLLDSSEKISEEGLAHSSAKLFPRNTILMAIYASPTLGRLGILTTEAACNQAALCLVANEEIISWQWLYQKLYELRDEFNAVAKGAGQQNISADVVKKKSVIIPRKEYIDQYTSVAAPIFDSMRTLQEQNEKLQEARDRLLPKLMNGEIEV